MVKCKLNQILSIIVLCQAATSTPKLEQPSQPAFNNTDTKTHDAIMSRLVNAIFPSDGSEERDKDDLVSSSDGDFREAQYLPPLPVLQYDCEPCNQIPWIPMTPVRIQNIVNNKPPKSYTSPIFNINSVDNFNSAYLYKNSLPESNSKFHTPNSIYNAPYLNTNYNALSGQHNFQNKNGFGLADYMMPPSINYKIPQVTYSASQPAHHTSKPIYGPPQKNTKPFYNSGKYDPRLKLTYGQTYKSTYDTPPEYVAPVPEYNLPKGVQRLTKPTYELPKTEYQPSQMDYGSLQSIYEPPKSNYGPPILMSEVRPSKEMYTSTIINGNQYEVPPALDIPLAGGQYGLPLPDNYINQDYNVPPSQSQTFKNEIIQKDISPKLPSDSYGDPVTGDNLDLADALSLPSGDSGFFQTQTPLPNLSSLLLLPVHSYREFNQNFNSKSTHTNSDHIRSNNDVEIQPSVKLTEYLASIEHPVSVIQSPLIELSVNEGHASNFQTATNSGVKIDERKPSESFRNGHSSNLLKNGDLVTSVPHSNYTEPYLGNTSNVNRYPPSFKLSENPIVVDDIHTSASNIKNSAITIGPQFKRNNDKHLAILEYDYNKNTNMNNFTIFSPPRLDYSRWTPSNTNQISTSEIPQLMKETGSRQLQIIIPYITNNKNHFDKFSDHKNTKESYTTLVPSYTPPISTEKSLWTQFMDDLKSSESKKVIVSEYTPSTTVVYNIKDLIASSDNKFINFVKRPYDVSSLQKNIDNWTYQVYSNQRNDEIKTESSKKIPTEYFPTKEEDIKSNLVISYDNSTEMEFTTAAAITTTITATTPTTTPVSPNGISHKISSNSKSNLWPAVSSVKYHHNKEKVYVVTPESYSLLTSTPATVWSMAPKIEHGKINNGSTNFQKFTVRIEPNSKTNHSLNHSEEMDNKNILRVVYSEWPHLINNLETTTTTAMKPTTRHPLFGLMDIIQDPNATVETFLGHSKVQLIADKMD